MRVVLDTNVVVSGLRSRSGVSFALLSALARGRFEIALTLPLYLEYRDVLGRPGMVAAELTDEDIVEICRGLADHAHLQDVHYLWRPLVRDPKDDLVLEAALASRSRYIVTHNTRDFAGRGIEEGLGVRIVTPRAFHGILLEESE